MTHKIFFVIVLTMSLVLSLLAHNNIKLKKELDFVHENNKKATEQQRKLSLETQTKYETLQKKFNQMYHNNKRIFNYRMRTPSLHNTNTTNNTKIFDDTTRAPKLSTRDANNLIELARKADMTAAYALSCYEYVQGSYSLGVK